MTICPIAIVVGCKKCPAFKLCPLKVLLGDQKSDTKDVDIRSKNTDEDKNKKS